MLTAIHKQARKAATIDLLHRCDSDFDWGLYLEPPYWIRIPVAPHTTKEEEREECFVRRRTS